MGMERTSDDSTGLVHKGLDQITAFEQEGVWRQHDQSSPRAQKCESWYVNLSKKGSDFMSVEPETGGGFWRPFLHWLSCGRLNRPGERGWGNL